MRPGRSCCRSSRGGSSGGGRGRGRRGDARGRRGGFAFFVVGTGKRYVVSDIGVILGAAGVALRRDKVLFVSDVHVDTDLGESVGALGLEVFGGVVGHDGIIRCFHYADFFAGFFGSEVDGEHGGSLFEPQLVDAEGNAVGVLSGDFNGVFDVLVGSIGVTNRVFPVGGSRLRAIGGGVGRQTRCE